MLERNLQERWSKTHPPYDQKPYRSTEPERRQRGHTPQYNIHVYRAPLQSFLLLHFRLAYVKPLKSSSAEHNSTEAEIRKHPRQHDEAAEVVVVIRLTVFGSDFLFDFGGLVSKLAHFGFVLGVEIPVVFRYGDFDFAVRFDIDAVKCWGFVVAFCAPAYVMRVAKGVHIEDVDVSWGKGEVLEKLCCSVRWKGDLVV